MFVGLSYPNSPEFTYTAPKATSINWDGQGNPFSSLASSDKVLGSEEAPLAYALIGDSHAQAISPAFDALSHEYGVRGLLIWTPGAKSSYLNFHSVNVKFAPQHLEKLQQYLEANNVKDVFIALCYDWFWEYAQRGGLAYKGERIGVEELQRHYRKELKKFIVQLAAPGRSLWIMEQVPRAQFNVPILIDIFGKQYVERYVAGKHNTVLAEVVEGTKCLNTKYISVKDALTRSGNVYFVKGNQLLYRDDDHLSVEGASHVKDRLRSFFEHISLKND